MKRQRSILYFDDINYSHEVMGFTARTNLPEFHVFTLEETYPSTRKVMPPYTFRFYCIMLLEENSQDAVIELNTERLEDPSNTLSFQSPGHISAWTRGKAQKGFIAYFQPEFLQHYVSSLPESFPFFRPTQRNILSLALDEKDRLRDHFVSLIRTYKSHHLYRVSILQALLLALLFNCKGLYDSYHLQQAQVTGKTKLANQFQQLLEQHYLTRQSVQSYAESLHVSPNYLSQTVSNAFGRGAYDLIVDRLLHADLDQIRASFETNLFGTWRMSKAFVPLLRKSQHPRIINVGSGAGSFGAPEGLLANQVANLPAYTISKLALNGLQIQVSSSMQSVPAPLPVIQEWKTFPAHVQSRRTRQASYGRPSFLIMALQVVSFVMESR